MQGGAELQMITREEIMKELAAGRSIDEIAGAITNTINEANTAFKEQEAAKAEAAAKEIAVKEAKRASMRSVLSALADYVDVAGGIKPEGMKELRESFNDDDKVDFCCEQIDSIIEMVKVMEKIAQLEYMFPTEEKKEDSGSPVKVAHTQTSDDIIASFLMNLGL